MIEDLLDVVDVERLVTQTIAFLPRLFIAIVILFGAWLLYKVVRKPLIGAMNAARFQPALTSLLVDRLFFYVVMIIGFIMAASQLGINVATALAGVGVAGIAIGFAAQDSVANMISGILIFWDKPFVVGDWIETEDQYGKVTEITLRTTRIRTPRNTYVVVPNKRIIDEVLENFSQHGQMRVDVPLGIAYKEDIRQGRKVLLDAVGEIEAVKQEPAPDVVVYELGDSSVNLRVRVWIDSGDRQRATFFAVMEACKIALDEAGIEIPFPHLQLFVDNVEDPVWEKASLHLRESRAADGGRN
ncbi:hypothetical protein BH24PSE2_BH24PSE2_20740 [soil metagenome]